MNILEEFERKVSKVNLTELREGVFYAEIVFEGGALISARPSDAIAIALRTGAPILATEELFQQAGIDIPDAEEDEVEKFREFLEEINPEDFLG